MQKLWFITVSLFFFFVYHLKLGVGIKCYVCRTDLNETCESGEINQEYSVECPDKNGRPATFCRKIHQKLRFKVQVDYITVRECAYEKGDFDCYFMRHLDLAYQETCECKGDNCNRGRSHSASDVLTITIMVFLWFWY